MLRTTIAAALALGAAPAAAADPAAAPRSVTVRNADLDLSREAGVAALDRRIRAAVRTVCPYRADADLMTLVAYRACARTANRSAADGRKAAIAASRLRALESAVAAR